MFAQFNEPFDRLKDLLARAERTDLREPTAMSVATADAEGRPTVRTVLLKMIDERGLVFFTSFQSRKGRALRDNPRASLCFFWQTLFEQALVDGRVETVSDEEADAYWSTRSRESQLSASASDQSAPLDSRQTLEQRVSELRREIGDEPVSRPPHWSGFRVVPERIEFWRAGWNRLHERVCYQRAEDGWSVTLLHP